MKPVCVPCQRFFRMKKSGFVFTEGMPITNDAMPGKAEPEKWQPYKVWMADEWECPDCGAMVLSGFGDRPMLEHYQPDFVDRSKRLGAERLQVNDC